MRTIYLVIFYLIPRFWCMLHSLGIICYALMVRHRPSTSSTWGSNLVWLNFFHGDISVNHYNSTKILVRAINCNIAYISCSLHPYTFRCRHHLSKYELLPAHVRAAYAKTLLYIYILCILFDLQGVQYTIVIMPYWCKYLQNRLSR